MGFIADYRSQQNTKRELKKQKLEEDLQKSRAKTAALKAQTDAINNYMNSGYSHGGASHSQTWSEKYLSSSYSAKSDIEENRKTLRERTRDLYMNAPLGTAAINTTRTNVVGAGLIPKPKLDYEFLGISQEESARLQQKIKKEFALWAGSTLCDSNDQNNFYELQQIAFSDWLKNGEEFALIKYADETPYMPYQLRLKLIEADRVCSPGSFDGEYSGIDKKADNGNRIMNGLEIDPSGKVVAYYISSKFPGEYGEFGKQEWQRIEKRGKLTGNPNILHMFSAERAEQYRGVPFLAPVIHIIKQMTRYTEAEVMAAVVNSMFTVFVTTESGDDVEFGGVDDIDQAPDYGTSDDDRFKMGTGTVNFLKEGEKIEPVQSTHPSGNYDSFIQTMAMQVGSALEISPEVLLKKFSNNFSASKGAVNETWKSFMMRRKWFINDFCQEVYELWFSEAVAKGRINAPGYFLDPMIRKAYTACNWIGTAQGYLNPQAEANAAILRINNGLSTHEDECAAINGSDFEENMRTLSGEVKKINEVYKDNYDGGQNDED